MTGDEDRRSVPVGDVVALAMAVLLFGLAAAAAVRVLWEIARYIISEEAS